jgi:CBS domain-containing protein
MLKNDIGCVIVVEIDNNGGLKPVGIITERDVVRILGILDATSLHLPLREIMSKPLVTISITGSIKDAIQTMHRNNIRHLVLIDKETMVGVITDKDIFKAITSNQTAMSCLGSVEPIAGQKVAYEQFTEYWFRDFLHKQ